MYHIFHSQQFNQTALYCSFLTLKDLQDHPCTAVSMMFCKSYYEVLLECQGKDTSISHEDNNPSTVNPFCMLRV